MDTYKLTDVKSVHGYPDKHIESQLEDLQAAEKVSGSTQSINGTLNIHSDKVANGIDLVISPAHDTCSIYTKDRNLYDGPCEIEEYLSWQSPFTRRKMLSVWSKDAIEKE